ncbi:MAG TPA: proton-conducting transporter membrane subunit [Longimicrobiaceae bacterium]
MLLALPILIPFATAIALKALPYRPALLHWVAFGGAVGVLASAITLLIRVQTEGIQVLQISNWPSPFGITLVADPLSAILVVMVGIVGSAVTGHSFSGVDPRREALGYHALIHVLLMGVSGAFLTGDVFNLYVWFEVTLIASFVLMALHRTREQLHAAYVYVTLNLIASALLLTAIGLLYGQAGTLNLADISRVWPERSLPLLDNGLSMLFLTAFGIKAGLFPLFFWLPASYHAPPAPIGALFAGLLTKVGVYAMIRLFSLLFREPGAVVFPVLLFLSIVTMLVGMVGALAQRDLRRVLSFNLVGHIGFTTVGLALWTPPALGASIFYLLHHMLVITTLFLVSGLFLRQRRTTDFASLGGLYRSHPRVALLVLIPVFSLAGVPPLSGFLGKLAIVAAALDSGSVVLAAVALLVSLLTLLSMARVWQHVSWKPAPGPDLAPLSKRALAPIVVLVLLTIGMTVGAGPVFHASTTAAEHLLDPQSYINAVLGDP